MFLRVSLLVSVISAIGATAVLGNIAGQIPHRDRRETSSDVSRCPPLSSLNSNVTCVLEGKEVPCDSNVQPGTIAKAKCKRFFKPQYYELTCLENGEWDQPLMDCTPECGSSNLDLTTDGAEAKPGAFPWHAGLYYRKRKNGAVTWEQKCSGTLINDQFVITVAHCVADTSENDLRVALGKYNRGWYKTEKGEEHRSVSTIIYQRDYSKKINSFGLAILRLNEKVQFGETIMPVCHGFPDGPTFLKNTDLYVVGWGLTQEGDITSASDTLLYNSVSVVNEDVCRNNFPSVYPTYDKFCTINGKQSKVSIAQPGDNGGGITSVYDGLHFLLGAAGAKDKQYSVFTNFTWPYNVIWIESEMRRYYPNFRWDENDITESGNNDRGCILPEASSSRRFCSLAEGCKNCDVKDPLCFVPPGSKVDRIRVTCEPGYTLRSPYRGGDVATCMNGQWYPELPQCDKYRYIPGSPWGKVTWQEAKDHCANKGHILATIKNKKEEETFKETVFKLFKNIGTKPTNIWTGLSDLKNDKTFEWVDGSILSKSDFSSWKPGEPSEYKHNMHPTMYLEHCVEALGNCKNIDECYHWNDNFCSELNYYFCKETVPSDATFEHSSDIEDVPTPKPRYTYLPGNPWSMVTWDEAKDNCMAKGGELAIIRAPDQQKLFEEAVEKQFKDRDTTPSSIWIGLRAAKIEGEKLFNWVDGSVYNAWRPHVWNNWIVKKSNWNLDCTEAAAGDTIKSWPKAKIYQWNDVHCTDKNYYFCSIKL